MVTHRRTAQNTVAAYRRDLQHFVAYLHSKGLVIEGCTPPNISNYIRQLHAKKLSAATVSRKISSLKSFFNYLAATYNLETPTQNIQFPKLEQKLPKYLNEEEITQLFANSIQDQSLKGQRNHLMLLTLYASGMRISEFLSLKLSDIIFSTGFLQALGKGNKERLIPLPQAVLHALRIYLDQVYPQFLAKIAEDERPVQKLLFFNVQKGSARPITRQSFWLYLKKLLLKAGIKKDISPHALRHSLASHLLKNGADLRSLQMLLGHENLSTVQIYTHLTDREREEVYKKAHPRS